MDQTTHDVRRANWLNIITQCQERQEGVTVKQWLSDNGVKEKAYYYWLRKFRKEAYEQMQPMVAKDEADDIKLDGLVCGAIYKLEEILKNLSPEEHLKERQSSIRPLVEEYFAWVKEVLASGTVLPKSETAKGLHYSINQEEYLRVFLTDGEVPIDDSASERALRNFTIDRKNWMTINTIRGAQASAIIYSITETARANNLNVYYYIKRRS